MNPSDRISAYIDGLSGWRGTTLGRPNFFKGASLADPHRLFNAGLEAKASRAIDLHQGDRLDEAALRDLIRAAVALERKPPKPTSKSRSVR